MSCRITHAQINGWRALKLGNGLIEVTTLPEKGADIYEFVDVASGIDVLMKTPWGLLHPGSAPRVASGDDRFLQNYEGAWQELLPNTGPACTHGGRYVPLHGEVATLPWSSRIDRDGSDCAQVSLDVHCQVPPLALTRRMRVCADAPVLTIEETVRNRSDRPVQFVWGHHPVLGAPFLEAGCLMRVASCTVHTPATPFDPHNTSYAPGQRAPWPHIRALDGSQVDLRVVPGPAANIHDHACLSDLDRGWVEVENPRLRLSFSLEWDPTVFRWINNWRPLGGSHAAPLEGIYGLALEPWVAWANLTEAVAAGTALALEPGASLSTWLKAGLRNVK
jgi:galactose mutarotase-like enzyme